MKSGQSRADSRRFPTKNILMQFIWQLGDNGRVLTLIKSFASSLVIYDKLIDGHNVSLTNFMSLL